MQTEQTEQTEQAGSGTAERDRRAERILDAAGELLVSWGYRRVTIDEVAQRAGVGKGTVYLHFTTKEALFLTVLLRAQFALGRRLLERMRADPRQILLSEVARSAYLSQAADPIIRAVVTGDAEVLGVLTRAAPRIAGGLVRARERCVDAHFDVLRAHRILRTDRPRALQRHAYSALVTGFLLVDPLLPGDAPDTGDTADMLAQTVRLAFEREAGQRVLARAAPEVIGHFHTLIDHVRAEIDRQKRT